MQASVVPPRIPEKIVDPYGIVDLKAIIGHPNRHMAQIIHGILTSHGAARVDEIEDEGTFRAVVTDRSYDVIFFDEKFADGPIFDFVRSFRRIANLGNRKTPIIVLMTEPKAQDVVAARDAGVNEIVIKPFSSIALSRHLARALKPRAFIKSQTYVGPDRRVRDLPPPGGMDRRRARE